MDEGYSSHPKKPLLLNSWYEEVGSREPANKYGINEDYSCGISGYYCSMDSNLYSAEVHLRILVTSSGKYRITKLK